MSKLWPSSSRFEGLKTKKKLDFGDLATKGALGLRIGESWKKSNQIKDNDKTLEIEHRNPRDREREGESGRREAYLAAGVGGGEDDLASATASAVPELMTSSLIPRSPSLLFFLKRRRKIKKKVAPFVPRGRFYSEKRDVRQRGALAIWTVKTDAQSPPSYASGEQRSDRSRPIHPMPPGPLRG